MAFTTNNVKRLGFGFGFGCGFVLCGVFLAQTTYADSPVRVGVSVVIQTGVIETGVIETGVIETAAADVPAPRLDLRRPEAAALGLTAAHTHNSSAEHLPAPSGPQHHFRLSSSGLNRHQVDQGTRMTGWKLGDEVFFGKSKGDLSGVALIWQRSQTDQVSLSGSGLKLTRRIN